MRAALAGIGLKDQHAPLLLEGAAAVDFVEVHAENLMVAGGPRLRRLERLRERLPLSIHGVGLSIGGEAPLDEVHLAALEALLVRFEPRWFSEHLAWSSHGGTWLNDLLPVPYDEVTLQRVCDHVDRLQSRLRRRMLLENPSTYVEFERSTMDEGCFLAEVVRRTGCGLLLDVNNVLVSSVNNRFKPLMYLHDFPLDLVEEIHLAGHAEDEDEDGARLLIDAHDRPVDDEVWHLYDIVIGQTGPLPTLIEWDNDVPDWPVLRREAQAADAILARHAETYLMGARHG